MRFFPALTCLTLLGFAPLLSAQTVRIWPGAAPCSGTLQACVDASLAGDTVLVASHSVIDESIAIDRGIRLQARSGFAPRLGTGRSIQANLGGGGSISLHIEGFELSDGSIRVAHAGSANLELTIRRNRLLNTDLATASIDVRKTHASGSLQAELSDNVVEARGMPTGDAAIYLGSNGLTTARIFFNRVIGPGSTLGGSGIRTSLSAGQAHQINVLGNRIESAGFNVAAIALDTGLAPYTGSGSGTAVFRVVSNAISCTGDAGLRRGMGIVFAAHADRDHELRLFNNTVVTCEDALVVDYPITGATVTGSMSNNLVAFNRYAPAVSGNLLDGFSGDRNLIHGHTFPGNPPALTNTITTNPQLQSLRRPRLASGSPAMNAGNAVAAQLLYGNAGLPQVDADGRRRHIGVGVNATDIGAFESGDSVRLVTRPSVADTFVPLAESNEAVKLQLAKVFNPGGGLPSAANPNTVGAFHLIEWFAYAITGSLPTGAHFSVFSPGPQGAFNSSYLHTTTSGNTQLSGTNLSNTHLNARDFDRAVVLATPVWLGDDQNTGNVAVAYTCAAGVTGSGCWRVRNQAVVGQPMAEGFGFHIYSQDPSHNAFVSRANGGELFLPLAGHAILGNDPGRCARPIVTPRLVSEFLDAPVETEWRSIGGKGTWGIYSEVPMPAGAEFFVFVDAAAFEQCVFPRIFGDGFESD